MSDDQLMRAGRRTLMVGPMNCPVWFARERFPFRQVPLLDAMDTLDNRNSTVRCHSLDAGCRLVLHSLCLSKVHSVSFARTSLRAEYKPADSSCSYPSILSRETRAFNGNETWLDTYRTFLSSHCVQTAQLVSLSLRWCTEWKQCQTRCWTDVGNQGTAHALSIFLTSEMSSVVKRRVWRELSFQVRAIRVADLFLSTSTCVVRFSKKNTEKRGK